MKKKLIDQLTHTCFFVKNLNKTIDFYKNILQFKIVHKFKNKNRKVYGVFLSAGNNTFIEIFKTNSKYKSNDSVFNHISFKVKNLKYLSKYLSRRGYNINITKGKTDKTLQGWLMDPNKVKIEFHQYSDQSKLNKYIK